MDSALLDRPMSSADDERDRIDLRAEPELVARLKRQAKRLGISMSAYIRLAVTRQVEQDESNDPKSHRRK